MRAGPGPPFLLSEGLLRRLHSVFFLVSIKDMNAFPSPFIRPDAAPEMVLRFGVIMAGLAALIARRFLRMPHLMRFTALLYGRIIRAVGRFERALGRPKRVRAKRVARAGDVRTQAVSLPRGHGWLVRELGYEAAAFMGQLEALLAEPAMQAALAGAPGRVLRPICRMLGAVAAPVVVAQAVPVVKYYVGGEAMGLAGVSGAVVPFAKID